MAPYAFLSLALWPLVCCGDECRVGLVCTSVSILLAVIVFVIAQLVRELWMLRTLRGYQLTRGNAGTLQRPESVSPTACR